MHGSNKDEVSREGHSKMVQGGGEGGGCGRRMSREDIVQGRCYGVGARARGLHSNVPDV